MDTTGREAYHVVCRNCPSERLFTTHRDAASFASAHSDGTGHVVVFDRVLE